MKLRRLVRNRYWFPVVARQRVAVKRSAEISRLLKTIPQDTPPCPRCNSGVAAAVGVMAPTGVPIVMFRCATCQHEWSEQRIEPEQIAAQKPDVA